MDPASSLIPILRFGVFELDPQEATLRRNGRLVQIQDLPLRLLAVLAQHPGTLVTREQLRDALWTEDDVVDFDRGLNTAVNRLRHALGDSAESPTFIETVPRRGYRFVAPLEALAEPEPPVAETPPRRGVGRIAPWAGLALAVALFLTWLSRDPLAGTSEPDKVMLAVLPFVDISADPEPYLGDGLTEEMIARLGSVAPGQLGVIARTTTMTFKGSTETVDRIGDALGVAYVLEGSVRRDDDDVRITVRLIEVAGQTQLWGDSYELSMRDLPSAQIRVAREVARHLTSEVLPGKTSGANGRPIDPRAYDAYLRGTYFRDMLTEEGFRSGIDFFEESIAHDPDFAPAYAGMAACYCLLAGHGLEVDEPAHLMTKARSMAERALQLDADLPIAHGALGMAKLKYEWDWDGAEAELERALELNPNEPAVHIWYAFLLSSQARHDEAIAHVERARDLDRFSRVANLNVAWQYFEARRYDRALQEFDATLELHPGSWTAHWGRGLVHSARGDHAAARADLELAVGRSERHPSALGGLGYVLARGGHPELARDVLRELTERGESEYVPPSVPAGICAALGDADTAFEWLERAFVARSRSLVWLAVAHEFEPLRSDPRYASLLRRMRLEEIR